MGDPATNLAREMRSWKSLRLTTQDEQAIYKALAKGEKPITKIKTEYIEMNDGKRFFDTIDFADDLPVSRLTGYSDGGRCASVLFRFAGGVGRQSNVQITRGFLNEQKHGLTERPYPFAFQYVGLIPLYEALPTAERLGPSTNLGRTCQAVLFRQIKGIAASYDEVYHLDTETSVPLRVEWFTSKENFEMKAPVFRWEASSLDVVSGYHVPLSSKYTVFKGKSLPRLEEKIVGNVTVKEIEYDKSFAQTRFWPEFEPGVLVMDALQNKSYVVPGGDGQTGQSDSLDEFGAGGPPDPWAWLTPVALGLGLTLLFVALVLKFRGRKAPK